MWSGILGVLVGFSLWGLLWVGSNQLLIRIMPGVFREDGSTTSIAPLIILLLISIGISVVAGYLAALIAQPDPLRYVWVLSVLVLIVGIVVQAQYWAIIPLWFHVSFLVALLPATLFGGWLRLGRIL